MLLRHDKEFGEYLRVAPDEVMDVVHKPLRSALNELSATLTYLVNNGVDAQRRYETDHGSRSIGELEEKGRILSRDFANLVEGKEAPSASVVLNQLMDFSTDTMRVLLPAIRDDKKPGSWLIQADKFTFDLVGATRNFMAIAETYDAAFDKGERQARESLRRA